MVLLRECVPTQSAHLSDVVYLALRDQCPLLPYFLDVDLSEALQLLQELLALLLKLRHRLCCTIHGHIVMELDLLKIRVLIACLEKEVI